MNLRDLHFVLEIESQPVSAQIALEEQWPTLLQTIATKLKLQIKDIIVQSTATYTILQASIPNITPLTEHQGPFAGSVQEEQFKIHFKEHELRQTPTGKRWIGFTPSQSTKTLLPEILNTLITKTKLAYLMHRSKWIRPVRAAACSYDKKPVHFYLERLNLSTDTQFRSHPLLKPIDITTLDTEHVKPKRIDILNALSKQIKPEYTTLLHENLRTPHNPDYVTCTIPSEFSSFPLEFLEITLTQHQKLIPTTKPYTYVAIIESDTNKELVIKNLNRVIHARLQDMRFFYQQDRKKPISQHLARLTERPFFTELGTYHDKRQRILKAAHVFSSDLQVHKSADLLYFDLFTAIVEEFPELEGIAARTYCEDKKIGTVLEQIMWPRKESDPLPPNIQPAALFLSWIKRLDTLVGFTILQKLPSGSRDPLGLRREGNGFIKVGMQLQSEIEWEKIAHFLADLYQRPLDITILRTFITQRALYSLSCIPYAKNLLAAHTNLWTAHERAQIKCDWHKFQKTQHRLRNILSEHQIPQEIPPLTHATERCTMPDPLSDQANHILDTVHIQSSPNKQKYLEDLRRILDRMEQIAIFDRP